MSEYKKPISIVDFQLAIKDLSDGELKTIKQKLETSLFRLKESNELMEKLMKGEITSSSSASKSNTQDGGNDTGNGNDNDDDVDEFDEMEINQNDINLFKESISENETVINNQQERIKSIDNELSYRTPLNYSNASVDSTKKANSSSNDVNCDNDIIDSTAPNNVIM